MGVDLRAGYIDTGYGRYSRIAFRPDTPGEIDRPGMESHLVGEGREGRIIFRPIIQGSNHVL